jgi:hypothetical protein
MNIALEKTQEIVQGVKRRDYGDAFVRGNNGKVHDAQLGFFFFHVLSLANIMYLQLCTFPQTHRA